VEIKNKIYRNSLTIRCKFNKLFFALSCLCLGAFQTTIHSQDLEPGFMSALPIGSNIAIAVTGFSQGNILLDKTIPVEDLEANMLSFGLAYLRGFKLFNRLAKIDVVLPYANANFKGLAEGEPKSANRRGLGDPMFRFSMILVGVEPMKPQEFFKQEQQKFKLGVSIRVKAPLGQYNPDKLINLGANRWVLKSGIGASYTLKRKLVFEAQLNGIFFGANDDFYGGNTSEQEPMLEGQFHTTYIFKPGIWLAASIGAVKGGQNKVNEVEKAKIDNNRYGLTFAYRLKKQHSLKAAYTNALITRSGDAFNTYLIGYQFLWFDKK
jgi:hypothetical protein